MSDFLVIAGLVIPVAESQPSQSFERIGSSNRTFAGGLRSTVRAEKRAWKFTTELILQADMLALIAATTLAAQVTCSGDALGGSVTCEVEIGEIPYAQAVSSDALNFMRAAALLLREV